MQHWTYTELTSVNEDSIHIELSAEGAKNETTGGPEHQRRKEDSCTKTTNTHWLWHLVQTRFIHFWKCKQVRCQLKWKNSLVIFCVRAHLHGRIWHEKYYCSSETFEDRTSYIRNEEQCLLSKAQQRNSTTKMVCFLKHCSNIILLYTGKLWLLLITLHFDFETITSGWCQRSSVNKKIHTSSFVPGAIIK